MTYRTALVIGAGAFGTSIANVLTHKFEKVVLKVRSKDVYQSLKKGSNEIYLPGKKLSKNIIPALTWEEVDENVHEGVDLVVSGLPTSAIKEYVKNNYERIQMYLKRDIPFVSLSKGIDPVSLELPDDLFFDFFPEHRDLFTFLSGPSFAQEIMDQQITLVALAGRSRKYLIKVATMLDSGYFKVLIGYDVKGTLLGGALKNILAISGGIIEGLGYNHNTRAAMITRGISEMLKFGKVFNARPETFYGLSGMGDLILTTTGDVSRNKLFGLEIAKGRKAEEIINSQRTVVEGYKTSMAVHKLAKKYEIRSRIFDGLYQVLYEDALPVDIINKMMRLPVRFEID
ncbi:MAG: NAD(P)-dependent glycerol-3-phosphate dehydrogenase [Bdellovibrionales bacterium]|nr:NAD(P)-dependent glycerol-3-phosphate dehydrogenase [Bdellovibrionales bacterium]